MIDKPYSEHVEIAIYQDGRLELDMSLAQLHVLNSYALHNEGKSLSGLAEQDPTYAYNLIKRMVGSFATRVTDVSIDDQVIARREDDGSEATSSAARYVITDRMPESYEKEIQFSLGIYTTEDDKLFLGDTAERTPVLDFTVKPPNYT